MQRICLLLLGTLLCSPTFADEARLFALIDERLELMKEVATWKWQHHVPIEDSEREAVVLDHAAFSGLAVRLHPRDARAFFGQQITAAKEVQHYWFERFADSPPRSPAPDLVEHIRPKLLELGDAITRELATEIASDRWSEFATAVSVEGLSPDTRRDLFSALAAIERYGSVLEQIRETGALRVGTTGDYPPFTLATSNFSAVTGSDIEMAADLAAALDATLYLVATSWPTLSTDLESGRFDVAMGGISITEPRHQVGFFSPPYHIGGKTPIAKCEDVERFSSLRTIDRPDVRVIVNPGGTNHAFVQAEIKQAEVIVFDDNVEIFGEIIAGNADVMITDAIEVQLKSSEHAELCPTVPGETFTYQQKGYFMQRDEKLEAFVSEWLNRRLNDGIVRKTMARYLEGSAKAEKAPFSIPVRAPSLPRGTRRSSR